MTKIMKSLKRWLRARHADAKRKHLDAELAKLAYDIQQDIGLRK
ncbi:hypothetical protein [Rhizobium sp. CFBP 8762]|nr:hypothetical protein [Rhizobium sp. CFBP 8762]